MPNYSSSVVRNLNTKLGETPSVLDFGANPSGTDATSAIQAGLNSVFSRGGGVLLLTPGDWNITGDGLNIPSNVLLQGQGPQCKILRGASLNAGRAVINFSTATQAGIAGFRIDGNVDTAAPVTYASFSTDPMHATLTQDSSVWLHSDNSQILIQDIEFYHSGGYSILADADTNNIDGLEILGNYFHDCRPHSFGTATGSCTNGAWTGGVFLRGDCRASASKLFSVKNVLVQGNTFKRMLGNAVWMHSYGVSTTADAHHQNIRIINNNFEDCALDAVEIGNLRGFDILGNTFHRIGYVTFTDSDTPTVSNPGYTVPVAIDCSGYAEGGNIQGNSGWSITGEYIDADGFRSGTILGNTFHQPLSGELDYTLDGIAGISSLQPTGINLGDTSLNGGATDVVIAGNHIRGCRTAGLRLNFAKHCTVQGNRIVQDPSSIEAPIQLFASTSGGGATTAFSNLIENNYISYSGTHFAIEEAGDPAAWAGCTNTIFNNRVEGSCPGEFLRQGSSSSWVGVKFSSNDPTLTSEDSTLITKQHAGTLGGLQFYKVLGTSSQFIGQLADDGPLLNIAEADALGTLTNSSGKITTGNRYTAGTTKDFVFSGKLMADGFWLLGDATYSDSDADQFNGNYGLLKYISSTSGTGTFMISTSTQSSTRVWAVLGGGTGGAVGGADTQYQFNDGGVFAGSPGWVYAKTPRTSKLVASSTQTADLLQVVDGISVIQGGYDNLGYWYSNAPAGRQIVAANYLMGFSQNAGLIWRTGTSWDAIGATNEIQLRRAGTDALGVFSTAGTAFSDTRDLWVRYLAVSGTAYNSVQAFDGGMAAQQFVAIRNDGLPLLTLSRGSSTARDWGFIVNPSGYLDIKDVTGTATRLTFISNGQINIPGVASQATLAVQAGYIQSAEGFLTTNTASNAIQAPSGGYSGKLTTLDDSLRLKDFGTASMSSPAAGYGGLAHKSGSSYWYWNGASWAAADLSAIGGGATPPGFDTYVIFNDGGTYGASAKMVFSKTPATLTIFSTAGNAAVNVVNGYINADQGFLSTATPSNTVNIPNGGVTAQQLVVVRNDGAASITMSRGSSTARQYGWRIDASGQLVLQDATAFTDRLTLGTAGTGTWATGLRTLGDLTFGSSNQFIQGSTVRINTTGGMVGTVFNATSTGASTTFQNSNSNFSVTGNGDLSMVGTFNCWGEFWQHSTKLINTSAQFVGGGVDCRTGGVGCVGYNYWNGSFYEFGQTANIDFTSYTGTATFKGGILVGH